ncbi:hypothetical protein D3C80_1607700 [compost metagenome]
MLEQAQVVRQCLGEAEAGIKDDPTSFDANSRTSSHPLLKITRNFDADILVMRIILHITRLTAHMHQTNRQLGRSRRIQGAVAGERADIIDQAGTKPG